MPSRIGIAYADGCLVIGTLANRHGKTPTFLENDADRANLCGLVSQRKISVGELAGLGIDDQVGRDAAT